MVGTTVPVSAITFVVDPVSFIAAYAAAPMTAMPSVVAMTRVRVTSIAFPRRLVRRLERDTRALSDVAPDRRLSSTMPDHFDRNDVEAPARDAVHHGTASNLENRFGRHEYDLETYGLTREQVDRRFAAYRERFGV